MSNYRLAPKPGVIRTNRAMPAVQPVVPRRSGVVATPATRMPLEIRVKQAPKTTKSRQEAQQQLQNAAVVAPVAPAKRTRQPKPITRPKIVQRSQAERERAMRKAENMVRRRRGGGGASGAKKRHDRLLAKYRDAIEKLKGVGQGRTLVIVACGPSILEAPLEKLRGQRLVDTMTINKPDARVWPTTYWLFSDNTQYNRNKEKWASYNGTIINPGSIRSRHSNQILIKHRGGKGFSKNLLDGFHIGRSSTYAAMQVAYWMNYDKVYIFGLDMAEVNGALHYYGQNPDVANANRIARFANEAKYYTDAADKLTKAEREKFVICSTYNPWDFVNKYSQADQKVAVDQILKEVRNA